MIAHQYITLLETIVALKDRFDRVYVVSMLSAVLYQKEQVLLHRTIALGRSNKRNQEALEAGRLIDGVRDDLRRYEVSLVFQQIHECKALLVTLQKSMETLPQAIEISQSFIKYLQSFEHSLQGFLYDYDAPSLLNFLESGNELYDSYRLVKRYSEAALEALAPEEAAPPGYDVLTLYIPSHQTYREVVEKLAAIAALYDEVCALAGVSAAEFPLQVSRLETGSLWLKIFGESKVMALLTKLIESGAGFIYRSFTREGRLRDIPRQIEVINSALKLTEELERAGIDTAGMKENIQKSSIVIAEKINTLLSGAASITINEQNYSIRQELERLNLNEGKAPLLGEGNVSREGDGTEAGGGGEAVEEERAD